MMPRMSQFMAQYCGAFVSAEIAQQIIGEQDIPQTWQHAEDHRIVHPAAAHGPAHDRCDFYSRTLAFGIEFGDQVRI